MRNHVHPFRQDLRETLCQDREVDSEPVPPGTGKEYQFA